MVGSAGHPSIDPFHMVAWKMKAWMISIGLLLSAGTLAQEPAGAEEIARDLIENGFSEEAEELYATITRHIEQPVDLNNCTRDELAGTGIFTPFQVFAIMDQRDRYGPFLSIYELASIPGITREFLEEIWPMINFSTGKIAEQSTAIDGMLLANVSVRLPRVSGMLQTSSEPAVYTGNILKYSQRIQLNYGDRLSLGAAFEKDPGESWTNRKRPEHLTGYLACTPGRHIKKLVIGNFRIHRGMGLVHRLGFSSRGSVMPLNGYRRSYVKPFASTLEYDYFRGVYAEAAAGKWEMDLFLSHQPADISFFRIKESHDLFGMTRQNGFHRTTGERQGFDLARLSVAGASFNRSGENHYAGCAFTGGQMRLTEYGKDSLKGTDPMNVRRAAFSLYGVVFGSTHEIYGEVALDNNFHGALLLGGSMVINAALSGNASVERISPGYRGIMPGPARDKEDVYNLRLGCDITPFRYGRIRMYHELIIPASVLSAAVPPVPERYTAMEFSYATGNGPVITLKYTGKIVQEILACNQPGNGAYSGKRQQHIRIHYRWEPTEKLILQGRLEISALRYGGMDGICNGSGNRHFDATGDDSGDGHFLGVEDYAGEVIYTGNKTSNGTCAEDGPVMTDETGNMAYQQVQLIPREGIRITYRYLLFHVPDWENRIYTYEPGVRYSFLFPSWYGKGSRNVLVVSAKISQRITLRGKCGLTIYAHRWASGSGNDLRRGNRQFDLELQLQANLF